MARKISLIGITAKKYLKRFPNTPILTLAKKMYNENKLLFNSVEAARSVLKRHSGLSGEQHRREVMDKTLFRERKYNYNPFQMPESHAEEWEPLFITSGRILIISDLHIPYQDNKAVVSALKYGKEKKVNCILIDGDLMDFHHQSKFEKDPRARSTKEEFESARQFLQMLRREFPNCRIIFKLGNHDERWEKWLYVKAPEIFDDPDFTLEARLRLGELGIEVVKDKRPVKIGKLTVLHGHELNGSGGVNPARATFLKTIDNVLIGHSHRSSQHTEPTLAGDVVVTTSIGCLCGMYPLFARVNKWNHGFAYVELDVKSGEYVLENKKIIKGKVY